MLFQSEVFTKVRVTIAEGGLLGSARVGTFRRMGNAIARAFALEYLGVDLNNDPSNSDVPQAFQGNLRCFSLWYTALPEMPPQEFMDQLRTDLNVEDESAEHRRERAERRGFETPKPPAAKRSTMRILLVSEKIQVEHLEVP